MGEGGVVSSRWDDLDRIAELEATDLRREIGGDRLRGIRDGGLRARLSRGTWHVGMFDDAVRTRNPVRNPGLSKGSGQAAIPDPR